MQYIDPAVIHASAARGDHWFPYAYRKPLPENSTQASIKPTQFIMHTEASGGKASNTASWNYWNNQTSDEAHFLLAMDPATEPLGGIWQAMDIFVRADNNAAANRRADGTGAVSVETQDLGGATVNATPWTGYQLELLGALLAWLHLHPNCNVQMRLCPAQDASGYGPHNLFGVWSKAAHSCPGAARTSQVPIVAAIAQAIIDNDPTPPTPPPDPEDEVPTQTIRIHLAGRNAEFWTQAPVYDNGPDILWVRHSGDGGPAYDQFVANHANGGRVLEVTYDPSVAKNWFLFGDATRINDSLKPGGYSNQADVDFRGTSVT